MTPQAPASRSATVNGCDTYGNNCDHNGIYRAVPPDGYNPDSWPRVTSVDNGQVLTAYCWAVGGITYNYAALHDPPDPGPHPYESTIYFKVDAPGGGSGYIPDTYFVQDKTGRLGLPAC